MSIEVAARQATERQVVRHLLKTAREAGFTPAFVWYDAAERVPARTDEEVLEAVFAVDESRILFDHPEERARHCVLIVLGNSGWDAIADHSEGPRWTPVMDACLDYAETLEA